MYVSVLVSSNYMFFSFSTPSVYWLLIKSIQLYRKLSLLRHLNNVSGGVKLSWNLLEKMQKLSSASASTHQKPKAFWAAHLKPATLAHHINTPGCDMQGQQGPAGGGVTYKAAVLLKTHWESWRTQSHRVWWLGVWWWGCSPAWRLGGCTARTES